MSETSEERYYRLRDAEIQTRDRHRELATAVLGELSPGERLAHGKAIRAARLAWDEAREAYSAACRW